MSQGCNANGAYRRLPVEPTERTVFEVLEEKLTMIKLSKPGTVLCVTALSLAVSAPAVASAHTGHAGLKHTALTLKATQEKVTKNDKFKATVLAKLRAGHAGVANETVSLQLRTKGTTPKWTDTGVTGTTATDGTVSFTFTQGATKQQYRVSFAGDSTYAPSHSGTTTIHRLK
jgi:hypothetical protein